MKAHVVLAAVAAVLISGSGAAESPANAAGSATASLRGVATTKEVMLGITIPMSDIVFQAAAEEPATDEQWEKVRVSALALAESGNLLQMSPRAVNEPDWSAFCTALIETSTAAAHAAAEKRRDEVEEAGNNIYEVCDGCHRKYMAARAGEDEAP